MLHLPSCACLAKAKLAATRCAATGDVSATEIGERGQCKTGQFVRDGCAAIGVSCRPDTERQSHHFYSRLARQYDTSTQIDDTSVLELLDVGPVRIDGEVP